MRKAKTFTINGETMTIPEFAAKYNINKNVLRNRITAGMSDEYIFLPAGNIPKKNEGIKSLIERKKAHYASLSWTKLALACYEIGATCNKCDLPKDIIKKCKMRNTIKKIVKEFGKPYERRNNFINDEGKEA
jgi:hypothetical protein